MKKTLLLIAAVTMAFSTYAQGTWKAPVGAAEGDVFSVAPGATFTEITGLSVSHIFTSALINKLDNGTTPVDNPAPPAPTIAYNGVTYDNLSIVQAAGDNGQYIILSPTSNGTLDVAAKMGNNKKTFVAETSAAFAAVSAYTSAFPGEITDATFPTVTTTAVKIDGTPLTITTQTWDNSTAINTTGANIYIVMSFPVVAGKTYAVGCSGSKFMLRGINYAPSTSAVATPSAIKEIQSVQYFNALGAQVDATAKGLVFVKTAYTNGTSEVVKAFLK
ncbi:MAG: hypothetical protein LBV75_08080 [Paludibacter sp.]|jgi:hypothetical protein|nr:hypothetical protein [Paludibacter sp.]